ncbi:MAG: matrixin family metalloprotease [Candidatus Paceibacterota bacterium]|jgi:hypothetical protein
MKRILKILILPIILGLIVYQFWPTLSVRFLPILNNLKNNFSAVFVKQISCVEPIFYNLGIFDTKFNISKNYFLSALVDAEAIWEKPFGKDLFTYAPTDSVQDTLKINLIYDYRQQATSKLASLGITVKDNRASYDMLKSKFTALKAKYDTEQNAFNVRVEAFNQKQQTYEEEVKFWNKKDGAPQKEYDTLQTTRLALENEAKELQVTQTHLNEMVEEINAFVVALNRLITSLNLSVDKYNTTNVSLGESFEEGVYSSDGLKREIDIYEFSSREKLVRVLAHELGHALDLGHVDDPKAIMYEFNQGNNMILTNMDLVELKIKCEVK